MLLGGLTLSAISGANSSPRAAKNYQWLCAMYCTCFECTIQRIGLGMNVPAFDESYTKLAL